MFALSPARLGRVVLLGCLCGLLIVSSGCRKGKGHVKGTVKFKDGRLMTGGTVTFLAADNRSANSLITTKGEYDVPDAPIGDVKVFLTVPPRPAGPVKMPKPPPGIGAMKPPDDPSAPPGAPPSPTAGQTDPRKLPYVPDRYLKADTSGLTLKVVPGDQTFPIVLDPS